MNTCYAITKPCWGLGNRIKCIIAACSMSVGYGIENNHVTVIWPLFDRIEIPLKDIFIFSNSTEIENEIDVEDNPWISDYFLPIDNDIPTDFSDLKWRIIAPMAAQQADETCGRSVDFQYHKIPQSFINSQKKYWDRIKPVDIVEKRIENVVAETVVHIRKNTDWYGHLTPDLSLYLDTIQKIDGKVYLIAHNQKVAQEICANFPNKIELLPDKNYKSFTDIVAEMLVVSRAKTIFATEFSSFPEVGWWMGGCKANVVVLGKV